MTGMILRTTILALLLVAAGYAPAALARMVEAEASEVIGDAGQGAARERAVQRAVREALLQTLSRVDATALVSSNVLVVESGRISAAGMVRDVVVLDEWVTDNVVHVRIRAQVLEDKLRRPTPAARYRKKIAALQFRVLDRGQISDLPGIEQALPGELLRRLDLAGAIVPVDATQYLLDATLDAPLTAPDALVRERISRITERLDAQFVIAGVIRDAGVERRWLQSSRRFELDVRIYDGISGAVIASHRVNEVVEGVGYLRVAAPFDSAALLRTDYGRAVDRVLDRLVQQLRADLDQLPFSARVVRSDGRQIYFDAGATSMLRVGDVLMTYRLADAPLYDAKSAQFMGYPETPIATLVVKQVQPLFAVGELEATEVTLNSGDVIRFGW